MEGDYEDEEFDLTQERDEGVYDNNDNDQLYYQYDNRLPTINRKQTTQQKKKLISPYDSYNISTVLKSLNNEYEAYKKVSKQAKNSHNDIKHNGNQGFSITQDDSYISKQVSFDGSLKNLQSNNISKIKEYLRIYHVRNSKNVNTNSFIGINKSQHHQNNRMNTSSDKAAINIINQASIQMHTEEVELTYHNYPQNNTILPPSLSNRQEVSIVQNHLNEQSVPRQKQNKSDIYKKLRSLSSMNSRVPQNFKEDHSGNYKFDRYGQESQNQHRKKESISRIERIKLSNVNTQSNTPTRERKIEFKDLQKQFNRENRSFDSNSTKNDIILPIIDQHIDINQNAYQSNQSEVQKMKEGEQFKGIVNIQIKLLNKRNSHIQTQENQNTRYEEYMSDYQIDNNSQATKTTAPTNSVFKKAIDTKSQANNKGRSSQNQSFINQNDIEKVQEPKKRISEGDIKFQKSENEVVINAIKTSLQKQIKQIEKNNHTLKFTAEEMPDNNTDNFLEFKAMKILEKKKVKANKEQLMLLEKKKEEFQKLIQQQQNEISYTPFNSQNNNKTNRKNVQSSMQHRQELKNKDPKQIYARISTSSCEEKQPDPKQVYSPKQQINTINKLLDNLEIKKQSLSAEKNQNKQFKRSLTQEQDSHKQLNEFPSSSQAQYTADLDERPSKIKNLNQNNIIISTIKKTKNLNQKQTSINQSNQQIINLQDFSSLQIEIADKKQKEIKELTEIQMLQSQDEKNFTQKSQINYHQNNINQDQSKQNNIQNTKQFNITENKGKEVVQNQENSNKNESKQQTQSIKNVLQTNKQNSGDLYYLKQSLTEADDRRVLRDKKGMQKQSNNIKQGLDESIETGSQKQVQRQKKFEKLMEYDTQKKFKEIGKIIDRINKNRNLSIKKLKDKDYKGKQVTFQLTESQLNSD